MNVTALLGAGAFLDVDGKSTPFLTQNVVDKITEIKANSFCKNSEPFLKKVADELNGYWKPDKCNFEDIYHTLEMLFSYRHYVGEGKPFRPPLGAFIDRHKYFFNYDYLKQSMIDVIKVLGDHVEEYDKTFQPDGVHMWFADFWRKAALKKEWNIATLNYDTCIEKSIEEFEDGFNEAETEIGGYYLSTEGKIQTFNCYKYSPMKIRGSNKSKIMHLHGSIQYGYPIEKIGQFLERDNNDLYKFGSHCEAKNSWDRIPYMQKQAQETTVAGPIITGLGKTDKLLCYPYIDYNKLFYESLLNNDRLLIAGYSFGDVYINKALDRFAYLRRPKKIVIITKRNESEFHWNDRPIKRLDDMEMFINRATMNDEPFGAKSLASSRVESIDKSIQLYSGGMKDAIENHGDEILDFLTT